MEEVKNILFKSSPFAKESKLIFHPNYLQLNKNNFTEKKFEKESIKNFRFGIKWLNGYAFTFGRIYCIDIENDKNEIIKIRLKSFYGFNLKSLSDKYVKIIDFLQDYYFDDISRKYLSDFSKDISIIINDIEFNNKGINFKNNLILWEDLETKNFRKYFSISSKSNSSKYVLIDYMNDWNGSVIYSVTRKILMDKGLF